MRSLKQLDCPRVHACPWGWEWMRVGEAMGSGRNKCEARGSEGQREGEMDGWRGEEGWRRDAAPLGKDVDSGHSRGEGGSFGWGKTLRATAAQAGETFARSTGPWGWGDGEKMFRYRSRCPLPKTIGVLKRGILLGAVRNPR
jgi:hypothetical protein